MDPNYYHIYDQCSHCWLTHTPSPAFIHIRKHFSAPGCLLLKPWSLVTLMGLKPCHQHALSLGLALKQEQTPSCLWESGFQERSTSTSCCWWKTRSAPCPPWLVSQILMPHFHMLGAEWPLLIKIWIYFFQMHFWISAWGEVLLLQSAISVWAK